MKLRKMKLKDFRGYEHLELDFHENMNVIIGRNDVGKSTILDALNIFFNDDAKPEILDCNIRSKDKLIVITACFEVGDDENIIIDSSNPTSLSDEYLLNEEGLLEISKSIKASGQTITKTSVSVSIRAYYPNIKEKPLITYKSADLKKLLATYEDDIPNYKDINKSKKADMRKALFQHLITEGTVFEDIEIEIKDIEDDGLKTWDKLKNALPLYTFFQSDRANNDGDREVQDPMKAITKEVLSELEQDLERIKEEVVRKVELIGAETIEKLKEFDEDIAGRLKTIPKMGNWDKLFNFSLDTDDDVPLNKRGSGIRRLILLSYFRAQAEKDAIRDNRRQIIYAIEEPETSQHPDFQTMIIETLLTISEKEDHQVFITTHTPEIAKMVDKESLIMIRTNEHGKPEIIRDEEVKIKEVIETLGILPTIHSKVVVCVEGKHDIDFLKNVNQAIPEYKGIIDLENDDVRLMDMGGSKLINWINENHFRDSGIKEFHLYDGDIPKYVSKVEEINALNDGRRSGKTTTLREMENYIPIELIEERFGCDLSAHRDNWGEFNVPDYLKSNMMQEIKDVKERENAIKGILNKNLTQQITEESLRNHGVYDEIKGWFESIRNCLD